MTVSELILCLSQMPDDAAVWMEGCDCWNEAAGVELRQPVHIDLTGKEPYVLLTKEPE